MILDIDDFRFLVFFGSYCHDSSLHGDVIPLPSAVHYPIGDAHIRNLQALVVDFIEVGREASLKPPPWAEV